MAEGTVATDAIEATKKKSFYAEEEDIEVKPSSELIPDEYEHSDNESVLFHVFRAAPDAELANQLLTCAEGIKYKVDQGNIHELNTAKELCKDLENIKKDSANKSAIILTFIGFFDEEERDGTFLLMEEETSRSCSMKEVWNLFASDNCLELKNKPKVFIFCTSPKPQAVQIDAMSHRTIDYDKAYDFPAEADLLIIHTRIEDPYSCHKDAFINKLCSNITDYSKKYDIIDIVSYIGRSEEYQPIVISSLTRKFYLTPSTQRQHFLSAAENNYHLEEVVVKIQEDVKKLQETQKKEEAKKLPRTPIGTKKPMLVKTDSKVTKPRWK